VLDRLARAIYEKLGHRYRLIFFLAEEGAALARELDLDAASEAVESGTNPARALADIAAAREAALVVVGSRGHGTIASAVLGSVASALVHDGETPVLVVRGASTS